MSYTIAIVGRPNVGKSTFFNRMLSQRRAIVDNFSGVTRDRHYGICEWGGHTFHIIDTGGWVMERPTEMEEAIARQVSFAVEEADALIFMVDVQVGITALDEAVAKRLYKITKPIFLVVNKVDNYERTLLGTEFYSLGFDSLFGVSSITGSGTGDLLDAIIEGMPKEAVLGGGEEAITTHPKIAVVGQPNAGKSTLLNVLLGEERSLVHATGGTTRDAVHAEYKRYGKHFILIDTAGIRKKNKAKEDVEFYAIIRAVKAIEESDVVCLLIDATKGLEHQDLHLFEMIVSRGKGVVLLVNKWDLLPKDTQTAYVLAQQIKKRLAPFSDVPVLFISALEKLRVYKAVEEVITVVQRRKQRIETARLNIFLQEATATYPPPFYRGHQIRLKYITQLAKAVPTFVCFCNFPQALKPVYRQYLENKFRERFDFCGVPLRFFFRKQ